MSELSDAEKAAFVSAAERRRKAGVQLKRIFIKADAEQVNSFYLFYNEWVERWGKREALETLLFVMAKVESRVRERERNGEASHPRFKKVSAPKVVARSPRASIPESGDSL